MLQSGVAYNSQLMGCVSKIHNAKASMHCNMRRISHTN